MKEFAHEEVAAVFDAYPKSIKAKLLRLRRMIFEVAARTPEVGPLEETLKWGQPSYLTSVSASQSATKKASPPSGASQ